MIGSAIAPLALLLAAALIAGVAVRIGPSQPGAGRTDRIRTAVSHGPGRVTFGPGRRAVPTLAGAAAGLALFPAAGLPAIVLALVLAGLGWLAPQLLDERRRGNDRAAALRQVQPAMALLRAQVAMGLGLESALRNLALSPLIGGPLAKRLGAVLAAYGLGGSVEGALVKLGRELESAEVQILARSISQARRLGVGLEETLARAEFDFANAHERRVAAAAERAQLRSQLLIVGCFLPAFMAMVLVPLFLGMLQGLGA